MINTFKFRSFDTNLLQIAASVDFEGLMSILRLVVASLLTSGFLPSESLIAGGAFTASFLFSGFKGLMLDLLAVVVEEGVVKTASAVNGDAVVIPSVFVSIMSRRLLSSSSLSSPRQILIIFSAELVLAFFFWVAKPRIFMPAYSNSQAN